MAFIPDDKIAEIRHAADIAEVISESVMLKKAGKNLVGLCPFHAEKTPSFTVNPDRQTFYCFGCGTGGDVFAFLQQHDRISFPEAVKMLAARYGIEIPVKEMTADQKRRLDERENLLLLNKEAKHYFHHALYSDAGQKAREYLKSRHIGRDIADTFELGFAPDGWDYLTRYLSAKKISPALAEKSGLIAPRNTGNGWYDRFRNRIIFPISDIRMQVIGFGGRVMDDSLPKYLNSPETPLYDKRRSLYGLHITKNDCREKDHAYIVEGYLDLLAMYQHGIRNAAATLGTALSIEHLRLLKGYAHKITLVYDSDTAGIKAAQRSIDIFRQEQIEARILILPQGHDPDSFLSEFGAEAFDKAARRSLTIIEFLTDSAITRYGLSPEGKAKVIGEMKPYLPAAHDIARTFHIRSLADRLDIDERLIHDEMGKEIRENPVAASCEEQDISKEHRLERQIIAMMLGFPEILPKVREERILDKFGDMRLKQIGEKIIFGGKSDTPEMIGQFENEEDRKLAASLAVAEEDWTYQGCLRLMDQFINRRGRRHRTLLHEIKKAEAGNDEQLLFDLLKKKQQEAELYVKHIGRTAERRFAD